MYVQVNLASGISFRRSYLIQSEENTFEFISDGNVLPQLESEYKEKIRQHLDLKNSNFFMYQNKLINMTKNHLPELFEDLSGSAEFAEEYEKLKKKKEEYEEKVR